MPRIYYCLYITAFIPVRILRPGKESRHDHCKRTEPERSNGKGNQECNRNSARQNHSERASHARISRQECAGDASKYARCNSGWQRYDNHDRQRWCAGDDRWAFYLSVGRRTARLPAGHDFGRSVASRDHDATTGTL
jgi:hypothetical protein